MRRSMTSKNSLSESYIDGRPPGDRASREDAYQTLALCHIAEMLTAIAYDLRAIREANTRKEDTE